MSKTTRKFAKREAQVDGDLRAWIKCVGCDSLMDSQRNALSRFDNKTHVCSECGQFEAIWQFGGQTLTTFGVKNISEMKKEGK